jgi:carboxyl-terminal processing protease
MPTILTPPLRSILSFVLVGGLVGASFVSGYGVGQRQSGDTAVAAAANVSLDKFWESWGILDKKFYGELDNQKRIDGAIGGMVAGLGDPYTTYLPEQQDKIFREDLQGEFGGIGAQLELRNGVITVVAPLQGTPAEKAGLQPGDLITKIDDAVTDGMSIDDAVSRIRGEKGSSVQLTIVRPGVDQRVVPVVRDTITVRSVVADAAWTEPDIAYIKINQFGDDTASQFATALQEATTQQRKGIILDLRNNPGGFLDKAVQMIGMVIPQNPQSDKENLRNRVAVIEQFKGKPEQTYRATVPPINDSIPMVVLVNGGSASASEIMSGALRNYGRATLVGTKTFGKGSVQDIVKLQGGGSVKVTIAHWLTPAGDEINKKGITPDVVVELPEGTQPSTTDAQVVKALEIIRNR